MKNLYLLLALCSTVLSFSQDFKLGNVSVKELKEEKNFVDPSAPAAILYKEGTTTFDFDSQGHWIIITDVKVRLKIYNKEGYRCADVEVPYYNNGSSNGEEITFSDVATYNLVNGKVEKTKVNDESKFTDRINKEWKIKQVKMPDVKEGSVIEYHYVLKSSFITNLDDWYFQYDIPVNKIEYNVNIPTAFAYNRILSPYIPVKETQESEKVTRRYSNTNSRGGYGQSTSLGQTESGNVSFYELRKTYVAENVPALKDEKYVDNIDNYRSFVKHELASYTTSDGTVKKYSTDWNTIVKSIYEDERFGREITYNAYYKNDLDEALKGKTQRNEIIEAVFNFVKGRMAWNEKYGYNCSKALEKAYGERTGNVAEINLMLISMLRYAGLTANPVLLSTRDNGHVSFINRNEFNYVIAGVEAQNGIVYLDATSKAAMPNVLPIRDLNGTGRIIRENLSSAEVDLMPTNKSKENTMVMAKIGADGVVTGQIRTQYYDYNAYVSRENGLKLSKDAYIEKSEKRLSNIEISKLDISNADNFSQPVVEDIVFTGKNLCDVINGKIYISPMLFYTMSENPLTSDKRSYPLDFIYPYQDKYSISITIPDGYKVESIPEPVLVSTKDNMAVFKFNIDNNKPNQIQMAVTNEINYARINPEYYETIKEFYASMIKKQTEKIVLVKS